MNLSDIFIDKGNTFSTRQLKDRLNKMGIEYDKENINKQTLISLYDEALKDQSNWRKIEKDLIADANLKNKNTRQEILNRKEPVTVEITHEPKLVGRPIIQNINITKKNAEENKYKDLNPQANISDLKQQQNKLIDFNEANKYGNLQAKELQDYKRSELNKNLSISNGKAFDEDTKQEKGKSYIYNADIDKKNNYIQSSQLDNIHSNKLNSQLNANVSTTHESENLNSQKANFPYQSNLINNRQTELNDSSINKIYKNGIERDFNLNILNKLPPNFRQNGNTQQSKYNSDASNEAISTEANKQPNFLYGNEDRKTVQISQANDLNNLNKNLNLNSQEDNQIKKRTLRNTIPGTASSRNVNESDLPSNANVNVGREKKHQDAFSQQQQIPQEFQYNTYRNNQNAYNNYARNRLSETSLPAIKEAENEERSNSLTQEQKGNFGLQANKKPKNFINQSNQDRLVANSNINQNLFGMDSVNNHDNNFNNNQRNDYPLNNFGKAYNANYEGFDTVNSSRNLENFGILNSNLNVNLPNANYSIASSDVNMKEYYDTGAFMPVNQNKVYSNKKIPSDVYNKDTSSKNIIDQSRKVNSAQSSKYSNADINTNLFNANAIQNKTDNDVIFQKPQSKISMKPSDFISENAKQRATYEFNDANYHPVLQEYQPFIKRSSESIQNQNQFENVNEQQQHQNQFSHVNNRNNYNNLIDINASSGNRQQIPIFNSAQNLNRSIQSDLNYDFPDKKSAPKRFSSEAANPLMQNSHLSIKNQNQERLYQQSNQSNQSNKMFIDEENKINIPVSPKAYEPGAKARFEAFIGEYRKIFTGTFAFGIVIVSLAGLNQAGLINVRSFAERGLKIMNNLNNFSVGDVINLFNDLIMWILGGINEIFKGLLRFTGASIWNNFYLIAFLIIAVLIIRFVYLKVHYRRISYEIFEQVKNRLREIRRANLNNFRAGLRLDEIINEFSQINNLNQNAFRENILPLLKDLRGKDEDIRSFGEQEAGKYFEKWQFKGF